MNSTCINALHRYHNIVESTFKSGRFSKDGTYCNRTFMVKCALGDLRKVGHLPKTFSFIALGFIQNVNTYGFN